MSAEATLDLKKLPFPLTDVDRYNLNLKDEDFTPHDWDELKDIIANNRLEVLRRWPSDLKRYIIWSSKTKAEFGTIMNFVMQHRLQWTPSSKSTSATGPLFDYVDPVPFRNESDYKILPNDWPYGLAKGIRHLIVWLKNRLEVEPVRGDMTEESRGMVETFVRTRFAQPTRGLPGVEEKVMWFKNWASLQSVPGIDHVHILVRDVPDEIVDEWTNGVRPVQDTTTRV